MSTASQPNTPLRLADESGGHPAALEQEIGTRAEDCRRLFRGRALSAELRGLR